MQTIQKFATLGAVLTAMVLSLTLLTTGYASRYDAGVFERVIRNRQRDGSLPQTLPPVAGYAALLDCNRVGDVVVVCTGETEGFSHKHCYTALVADCAGIVDGGAAWMHRYNIAAELDYDNAIARDLVGKRIRIYSMPEHKPSSTRRYIPR